MKHEFSENSQMSNEERSLLKQSEVRKVYNLYRKTVTEGETV